jgi:hypothetical protein
MVAPSDALPAGDGLHATDFDGDAGLRGIAVAFPGLAIQRTKASHMKELDTISATELATITGGGVPDSEVTEGIWPPPYRRPDSQSPTPRLMPGAAGDPRELYNCPECRI